MTHSATDKTIDIPTHTPYGKASKKAEEKKIESRVGNVREEILPTEVNIFHNASIPINIPSNEKFPLILFPEEVNSESSTSSEKEKKRFRININKIQETITGKKQHEEKGEEVSPPHSNERMDTPIISPKSPRCFIDTSPKDKINFTPKRTLPTQPKQPIMEKPRLRRPSDEKIYQNSILKFTTCDSDNFTLITSYSNDSKKNAIVFSERHPKESISQHLLASSHTYLSIKIHDLDWNKLSLDKEGTVFNSNLVKTIKEFFDSKILEKKIPEFSLKTMEEILATVFTIENQHWFLKMHHELKNMARFNLTQSLREELFLNIALNSGIILIPIIQRLNIAINALIFVLEMCKIKTVGALSYYKILKDLLELTNFNDNKAGLKQGIILKDFLVKLIKIRQTQDINLKNIIELCLPANGVCRDQVIEYLNACTESCDDLKKLISNQIRDFDALKINLGMIPLFKHVCYESKNASLSLESIPIGEPIRCIKMEDERLIIEAMKINGRYFYNEALVPPIPYYNISISKVPKDVCNMSKEDMRLIERQKAYALLSCLRAKTLPFYKRILTAFVFELSKCGIPDNCTRISSKWSLIFKELFCKDDAAELQTLIGILLEGKEEDLEIYFTKLEEKNKECIRKLLPIFIGRNFWEKATDFMELNKTLCDVLCYLIALEPWVELNADRFLKFIQSSEPIMDLTLLKILYSQKMVLIEIFSAHYYALKIERTMEALDEEVDYFIECSKKNNTEARELIKEKPIFLLPILRLYTNTCFGFAESVFRILFAELYKSPFSTITKRGTETGFSRINRHVYEGSMIRKYCVQRNCQTELAIIPVSWAVVHYKDSWKYVFTVPSTPEILPGATKEEALKVTSILKNYSRAPHPVYTIESSYNEDGSFTFYISPH